MKYIKYFSIRLVLNKFVNLFNKIKLFFFPKTCYDYIFNNEISKYNSEDHNSDKPLIVNIKLPFKISRSNFDNLNQRNNNMIEYINDKEIGIPSSTLVDVNDILPYFASNKKSIIKIIELNSNEIIESYKNTYIYVKNVPFGIGNQSYQLSLQIEQFINSTPKRKELGQGNCGFTKFILPNGYIRHPDYYFISHQSLIHYNKSSNFYSAPPNFIIEMRGPQNSIEFYKYKSMEWIKQGVESVLLIDSYGNKDSVGSSYYFCLSQPSPILLDQQLSPPPQQQQQQQEQNNNNNNNNKAIIPNSIQYVENNNKLKSINDNDNINILEYNWDNSIFPNRSSGPDIQIPIKGILNGATLDLSKLINKR